MGEGMAALLVRRQLRLIDLAAHAVGIRGLALLLALGAAVLGAVLGRLLVLVGTLLLLARLAEVDDVGHGPSRRPSRQSRRSPQCATSSASDATVTTTPG